VYEFFVSHLFLLLLVFMIQSILRAVVSANFSVKALTISGHGHRASLFQQLYYGLILAFYVCIIILSFNTAN
jgi:hypothetical protein